MGIPGSFRHHHTPIIGHGSGDGTNHDYDSPSNISPLRRGHLRPITRGGGLENLANDHGDHGAGKNPNPLHRKHSRDERATCPLVSELGHDGGGQGIVSADAHAEKEAEEAEACENAALLGAYGEAAAYGAEHHEHERHAVDPAPAYEIAEARAAHGLGWPG